MLNNWECYQAEETESENLPDSMTVLQLIRKTKVMKFTVVLCQVCLHNTSVS